MDFFQKLGACQRHNPFWKKYAHFSYFLSNNEDNEGVPLLSLTELIKSNIQQTFNVIKLSIKSQKQLHIGLIRLIDAIEQVLTNLHLNINNIFAIQKNQILRQNIC